jgi:transcriptional regulator with XRE-family HTH domain
MRLSDLRPNQARGGWVRQRAQLLHMNLSELAETAGMTRAYLHRLIDGGVDNPGLRALQRLAVALQVPLAAIVRLWGVGHEMQAQAPLGAGRFVSPHDVRDVMVLSHDVTLPAHTAVMPGERVVKTWGLQNQGCVPWPMRRLVRLDDALVLARRDAYGALVPLADVYMPSLHRQADVPPVPPGGVCDVSVELGAPLVNGSAASVWQLQTSDGTPCYDRSCLLTVFVTVVGV